MGVRAERRKQMQERLQRTAVSIVGSDGLEALTMQRLADELGVTPGALYRYEDSREALIARLLIAELEALGARTAAAMQGSALDNVWAACGVLAHFSAHHPKRYALLAVVLVDPRVLVNDLNLSQPVMDTLMQGLAPIIAALAEAQARGELSVGVPTARALILIPALIGVLSLRKQERHSVAGLRVDKLAHQLVASLLVGWGAERAGLPDALPTPRG